MGMYTELIFGASLKANTPKEVIDTIKYMIGEIKKPEGLEFKTISGRPILISSSYYFGVSEPVIKFCEQDSGTWMLSVRCNTKNYQSEIESFLDWIKPYIQYGSGLRDMYAITIFEEAQEPTIYYLSDEIDDTMP